MTESPRADFFPRSNLLPDHSPKYWAKNKDRFLRQLLISDIEQETGRSLVVYFASADAGINHQDAEDLYEVMEAIEKNKGIDLYLQTRGGSVDATEKIIRFLRGRFGNYRVIVPNWAKSGGTLIALAAERIIMGTMSELGPIDPQYFDPKYGAVACELLENAKEIPSYIQKQMALTVDGVKELAKEFLKERVKEEEIDKVVNQLSSVHSYGSHAAVIDFHEAKEIGLPVDLLKEDDPLWQKMWFLYCLYDEDMRNSGLARICETIRYSITRLPPPRK